jgi:predicted secreted protein
MSVLGLEVTTALNTATIASPTWDVVGPIKDETLNMSKSLVDVTTRLANGWRLQRGALKEATIDLQLLYLPDDTDFQAFQEAFFDGTQLIIGLFDGDIEVDGTYNGLHSAVNVTGFSIPRNLEDAVVVDVTLVLDLEDTTNTAPSWAEITISS